MFDIHTHLHFPDYDNDRDEVIRRAREAGVKKMICVGTSPEDNKKAIEVAKNYENVFVSVGIHPHFFDEQFLENKKSVISIKELRRLAKHPKTVAIGECGLDYFSRSPEKVITEEQKKLQKELFVTQIEVAKELSLPLIIHTRPSAGTTPFSAGRDAYDDMYDILKNHPLHFILHCYQGDMEITKKFMELLDVYFSFAGNITYPIKKSAIGTKDDLQETLKFIPLERLFVETDCPYLAPEGKRGERNEPAYVQITAQKICALKGITMTDLEAALDENFRQVFTR